MMVQNKTKDHVSKQAPLVYMKVYNILYTTVKPSGPQVKSTYE
jgi:hypothetical protein